MKKTASMKNCAVLGAALLGAALSGCASTTPGVDERHGDAVRQLNMTQTLDPSAPRHLRQGPTEGRTVKASMDAMLERYVRPPASDVQATGVSGGAASGTTR